jgi:hypothetical protein
MIHKWIWTKDGMLMTGTVQKHSGSLSQWHFVHHKSRMDWTGRGHWLPWREAGGALNGILPLLWYLTSGQIVSTRCFSSETGKFAPTHILTILACWPPFDLWPFRMACKLPGWGFPTQQLRLAKSVLLLSKVNQNWMYENEKSHIRIFSHNGALWNTVFMHYWPMNSYKSSAYPFRI